jgi:hypothetical protein
LEQAELEFQSDLMMKIQVRGKRLGENIVGKYR